MAIELRQADERDIDVILATFRAGLASYVEFAPAGWEPPELTGERERTAETLADPETWALIATEDGEAVGHVAFVPARERAIDDPPGDWRLRPLVPGMTHLWQLFVLPPWWGTGVAGTLHRAAVEEMRRRGFASSRLFTPAYHARARRFYERRGWIAVAEGADRGGLGLDLVECRLEL
jgi:GNAT superfamily N-acetyltransferase